MMMEVPSKLWHHILIVPSTPVGLAADTWKNKRISTFSHYCLQMQDKIKTKYRDTNGEEARFWMMWHIPTQTKSLFRAQYSTKIMLTIFKQNRTENDLPEL